MSGVIDSFARIGATIAHDGVTGITRVTRALDRAPIAGPAFDVDLLVAGAGPGGGTAAAIAAGRGAKVLVAELRAMPDAVAHASAAGRAPWGQRWQQVIVQPENLAALREAGVADELFGAAATRFEQHGLEYGTMALGPAERALAHEAVSRGAELRFGGAVDDVTPHPDGGVLVRLAGEERPIRARTFIDATGGRSSFLDRYGLALGEAQHSGGTYFLGHYPTQPGQAVRSSTTVRETPLGDVDVLVLNHPEHGAHVDIQPGRAIVETDSGELAELHQSIARRAGVHGEALDAPYVVRVAERESAHVVGRDTDGDLVDMITIGDGVARKGPRAAKGANAAIKGGRDAASAALLEGPERRRALEVLEESQRSDHQGAMVSHSYAARESARRLAEGQRQQDAQLAWTLRMAERRTAAS
ncbi:MAG: dependent oxidoreductase [Thermoleophilia bacterium]|nr:dependent oxidoreductase [Thermoleophilia bacterium]